MPFAVAQRLERRIYTALTMRYNLCPILAIYWLNTGLELFQVVQVLSMGVVTRCQAEFSNQSRRWLTVGTFLAQYLVPLLFTTVSYLSIMRRLSQRSDGLGNDNIVMDT